MDAKGRARYYVPCDVCGCSIQAGREQVITEMGPDNISAYHQRCYHQRAVPTILPMKEPCRPSEHVHSKQTAHVDRGPDHPGGRTRTASVCSICGWVVL